MEMIEHPDISAMMQYGTLEKSGRRRRTGFLFGYVYERSFEEEEDNEGYDGEYGN